MLQSIVLIRRHAAPDRPAAGSPIGLAALFDEDEPPSAQESRFDTPEELIGAAGLSWREYIAEQPSDAINTEGADAVLLCMPYASLLQWMTPLARTTSLPLLWWCEHEPAAGHCALPEAVDGMLFPGMTTAALHWSLELTVKQYMARTQWETERKQLLAKVDDRKWIDRAISILSEVKSISETEAYEFLRKQSAKERRRMPDVAVSIVNVYSLLREQYPRGRSR